MLRIAKYHSEGCECKLGPNKTPCIKQFSLEYITNVVLSFRELTSEQLDLVILGQLPALLEAETTGKRKMTTYFFRARTICRPVFCFIHNVSEKRFKNLKTHFQTNGAVPRMHGNKAMDSKKATPFDVVEHVKHFIENYGAVNGLYLPGRVPGYKNDQLILLPSHHTKSFVHKEYEKACVASNIVPVSYRKYRELWSVFFPYILAQKPRTDLCFTCQKNVSTIIKMQNREEVKSEALKFQELHLKMAAEQRNDYNTR